MRDHYDFSNAVKNPYAESIKKNGYTMEIHHNSDEGGWDEIIKVSPDEVAARAKIRAELSDGLTRKEQTDSVRTSTADNALL